MYIKLNELAQLFSLQNAGTKKKHDSCRQANSKWKHQWLKREIEKKVVPATSLKSWGCSQYFGIKFHNNQAVIWEDNSIPNNSKSAVGIGGQ